MKHTITFNLPDDRSEMMLAIYAGKFFSALHDIQTEIRNRLKHEELSEETIDALTKIREMVPQEIWEVDG